MTPPLTRARSRRAQKRRSTNSEPPSKRAKRNCNLEDGLANGPNLPEDVRGSQNESSGRIKTAPKPDLGRRRSNRLANREAQKAKSMKENEQEHQEEKSEGESIMEEEPTELIKTKHINCRPHFSVLRNLGFSRRWRDYGTNMFDQQTDEVLKGDYKIERIRDMAPGDKIWTMEVDPAHNFAFTGSKSGRLGIWNFVDDTTQFSDLHSNRITDVIFSSDNKSVVTTSTDGYVKFYDVYSGGVSFLGQHRAPLHSGAACHSSGAFYVGGQDGQCMGLDPRAPRRFDIWSMARKKIASLACHGYNIYSASNDNIVAKWDSRKCLRPIDRFSTDRVQNSVKVSHDGSKLVVSGRDDFIRVYSNLHSGFGDVQEVKHNNNTGIWISPFRPTFHPSNPNYVFSGELQDRCLGIYNFSDRRKISKFSLKDKKVGAVFSFGQYHALSERIISVSYSKVHVWTKP